MKKSLSFLALLALLATAPVHAQGNPVDLGSDPALAIAGRDLPPTDARVTQAREWLKKVAEVTGETEEQVAASCIKLTRFLFDSLRVRALPVEALEGLAVQAVPGKALSDLTSGYFQARRTAPGNSHADALANLAKSK